MWHRININKQNIKAETSRAILIALPHSCDYNGYSFWHPLTLVTAGKHSNAVEINCHELYKFRIYKYGKGKWNNRSILDEKVVSVEEIEDAFGIMNENIKAHSIKNEYETHKPDALEPVKSEVLEELKDE